VVGVGLDGVVDVVVGADPQRAVTKPLEMIIQRFAAAPGADGYLVGLADIARTAAVRTLTLVGSLGSGSDREVVRMSGTHNDFCKVRDGWLAKLPKFPTDPPTAGAMIIQTVRDKSWPVIPYERPKLASGLLLWAIWVEGDDEGRRLIGHEDIDVFVTTRDLMPGTYEATVRVERRRVL
jgi:hypothetical protein